MNEYGITTNTNDCENTATLQSDNWWNRPQLSTLPRTEQDSFHDSLSQMIVDAAKYSMMNKTIRYDIESRSFWCNDEDLTSQIPLTQQLWNDYTQSKTELMWREATSPSFISTKESDVTMSPDLLADLYSYEPTLFESCYYAVPAVAAVPAAPIDSDVANYDRAMSLLDKR